MPYVSILGDSISTFEGRNPAGFAVYYQGERREQTGVRSASDTWWARVIEHIGGQLLVNGSYSGSMVEGASFPAGSSPERVAALGARGIAPDVVIVFMGINDYGWGGAVAQAAGRGNALPEALDLDAVPSRVAGRAPADAAKRFAGAYGLALERIRGTYPEAVVWCCTLCPGRVTGAKRPTFAFNLRGVPFDAYNDAIRAQARAHGCRVADVRALGVDYEALDGTHPTARGMRQLADLVVRAMESAAPDGVADGASAPDSGLRSAELCPHRACVGCEHARDTGNTWSLVCEKQLRRE